MRFQKEKTVPGCELRVSSQRPKRDVLFGKIGTFAFRCLTRNPEPGTRNCLYSHFRLMVLMFFSMAAMYGFLFSPQWYGMYLSMDPIILKRLRATFS